MMILDLPPSPKLGRYQHHVIEHGHIPGVLSGAELRGKARRFGYRYKQARHSAVAYVTQHLPNVKPALVLHPDNHRWCVVWTTDDGELVRLQWK